MRRKVLVFGLAAICVLTVFGAGAGASAQSKPTLIESGGARFPSRFYILTLPSNLALTPSQVDVRENGNTVSGVSIVPANMAGGRQFAVVLVIDTSNSMAGEPIKAALAAARAFASHRTANQKLAIVTFNRQADVLLGFTTSSDEVTRALSTTPQLAEGTHIYDGVGAALNIVREAKLESASIILLSDGADTGSTTGRDEIAVAARAARVRVFSVGLRSPRFHPAELKGLASAAGGEYSEASSSRALARIYDELGAQLSNEYLIRYRSLAGPKASVQVEVNIAPLDEKAVAGYVSPGLPQFGGGSFHRSVELTFWRSAAAMLLVALLSALLVASAVFLLLRPRNRGFRRRIAEFVSLPLGPDGKRQGALTDRVFDGTEKSLSRLAWWDRFKQDVELAEIRMPPVQIVLWTFVGTVFTAWLVHLLTGSLLLSLLAIAIPFATRAYVKSRVERRRGHFAEQLPDNLQVLASALRAGHSFIGALSVVVDDSPEPARSEFRRVIADEQLGVPLEDAIGVVVRRMENRDLEQVALVAALQRETGGSAAEVIDRVSETIRERFELRRLVKGLTAQGRMARWIVSLLPVMLLIVLTILNPHYMQPLYTHSSGRALLFFASVMVILGSLVIKKIVNIKV